MTTNIPGYLGEIGTQQKSVGPAHQAKVTKQYRSNESSYDMDEIDELRQLSFRRQIVDFTLEESISPGSVSDKVIVFSTGGVMGQGIFAIGFDTEENSKKYFYWYIPISCPSPENVLKTLSASLRERHKKIKDEMMQDYIEALQERLIGKELKYLDPASENVPDTPAVTVEDMVQKIRSVFGLNLVQVSDVIGVSEKSLHADLVGKRAPESLDPYRKYYDLALEVEKAITVPLKPGLKSVLVDGKTLLRHLKEKNCDREKILSVAREVSRKLAASKKPDVVTVEEQRRICRLYTRAG